MPYFEVVAHRGVPTEAPENTIPSFQRAIDLGADAIEFDVRLTRDGVPIIHHYFYLHEATAVSGPVFNYTFDQLQDVNVLGSGDSVVSGCGIWMRLDVVTYLAVHRARLAHARAVHLHPTQLSSEVVSRVRSWGIEVHAWDVNDEQSLNRAMELGIPRICTDKLEEALDFRQRRSRWTMAET